jgi:fatty acid desaturase
MNLYEPKTEENEAEDTKSGLTMAATGVGLVLGAVAAAALESFLIWLILVNLVGVTVTFVQVLGVMLIVNAVLTKFK